MRGDQKEERYINRERLRERESGGREQTHRVMGKRGEEWREKGM